MAVLPPSERAATDDFLSNEQHYSECACPILWKDAQVAFVQRCRSGP